MTLIIKRPLKPELKKQLAVLSGYKCSFPGCAQDLMLNGTTFIGQIASIEALHSHGPRYSPVKKDNELLKIENYLLLCPNHHAIIDKQPEIYTVEWLKKARQDHLNKISGIISAIEESSKIKSDDQTQISIEESINIWKSNRTNSSEEFWQSLFQKCPQLIAFIFPQSMFQLGSKCYVGGKTINNSSGNLVDFIYASKLTGNVALVEIKTPITKLLGKKYRNNAYSISDELSGSLVQALNYKDQLLKEYYKLCNPGGEVSFSAFSPKCLVIAGTTDNQFQDETQYKSFDLFRNCISDITIITYDELFQKAQDILDMTK